MIFPLFNERHAIAGLVERVPPIIAETIVVDDGSDDGGPDLARAAGARVISQDRRRGVGAAIRTGIESAGASGHGFVVVLAANGKDDPAEAPRLIDKLSEGYDYVQGSRFLREGGASVHLPRGRGLMIRGYTFLFRVLSGFAATDVTNGFRAYRLSLLDDPRIRIDQAWLDRYEDRKSTRLNSSHSQISYAVFCLKKKIDRRAALLPIPSTYRCPPVPCATSFSSQSLGSRSPPSSPSNTASSTPCISAATHSPHAA